MKCEYRHNDVTDIVAVHSKLRSSFTSISIAAETLDRCACPDSYELFRTIVRFLETDILRVEPYLAVGIIACVRRILTASAELGDLRNVTRELFENYLKDVALDTIIITLLIIGIFILRARPTKSDQHDFPLDLERKAHATPKITEPTERSQ